MVLLTMFAIVAGAATAITPCVLPVLPALLSAGGTGGRRRPLGIVTGLAVTHTITIVGLATVVGGVGFADGTLRSVAIGTLVAFGLVLLLPKLGHWFEDRLAFMSRFGPRQAGDGFWSGLPVGAALGFVYAPCAGPILAAVISVSASQGTTTELVLIAIGYSLGSAVMLLAITLGGRRLMERIRKGARGPVVQRALGGILVATAIAMTFDLDLEMQSALADDFPSFITNPTKSLEDSDLIQDRLADVRGEAKFADAEQAKGETLEVLGTAPAFRDTQRWFNSQPLSIAGQRGKVTLVDFWTYSCINCIRTVPYLKAWDERYRKDGLTIVGVHTPEFGFERDADNVADAIERNGLRYPVVQDNDFGTWNAWQNKAWPSKYLVDAEGRVRYAHQGEGDYDKTEAAIRQLLAEAGSDDLGDDRAEPKGEILRAGQQITPETFLGADRIAGFAPMNPKAGTRTYKPFKAKDLFANEFTLGGRWSLDREHATARSKAVIKAKVTAKSVYLVMASDAPRDVAVQLDGRPISDAQAGSDVRDGRVRVSGQRLYRLVELDKPGEHELKLTFGSGVRGYAFTFG